jgi:arylformamidase
MTVQFFSHPFSNPLPVYGTPDGKIDVVAEKSIAKGDSSHTFLVTLNNHSGTHVDGPAHFFENASAVVDYPADFWIFEHPQVVEIKAEPAQLIDVKILEGKVQNATDLLIIKTGFQSRRGGDDYSCRNPGIAADVGFWLREQCPNVRAIGLDLVSLSSFQNRPAGRLAHKAFLDPKGQGHPVLIIEDMDLAKDLTGLHKVVVAPLLIKGIDSAPCTIIGFSKP